MQVQFDFPLLQMEWYSDEVKMEKDIKYQFLHLLYFHNPYQSQLDSLYRLDTKQGFHYQVLILEVH